jgi:hypothetical protein
MPISLAIIACGCGLIYFGTLGLSPEGIRFTRKKTLVGTTAKIIGIFCIAFGLALIVVGVGLIVLISTRTG